VLPAGAKLPGRFCTHWENAALARRTPQPADYRFDVTVIGTAAQAEDPPPGNLSELSAPPPEADDRQC